MFIWDFILGDIMDQLIDWVYGQVIGFLGNFFSQMGNMGMELFEMNWVASIVLFFSYLAWALYGTGLVVSCFETGIEYQHGRGSVKDAALNAIKGFMAVSLFTIVPVELFKLSVNLQSSLTAGITGYGQSFGEVANEIITGLGSTPDISSTIGSGIFGGFSAITSPIMLLFMIIMMGYAVIKVFFANLKRGGILLIQIAVGSLYMFSVPRGYIDGFVQWCKQVIGLCLTTFLQATILTAGLMVLKDHALLGLGLMLAAGEVPRIAGAFGLDTSTKANMMSAVYTAQAAVNTTRTVVQAVAPK
ncbi:MAG: conjugal transfer protein TrbL family protein [Candidatus Paceibacterota bacterium]